MRFSFCLCSLSSFWVLCSSHPLFLFHFSFFPAFQFFLSFISGFPGWGRVREWGCLSLWAEMWSLCLGYKEAKVIWFISKSSKDIQLHLTFWFFSSHLNSLFCPSPRSQANRGITRKHFQHLSYMWEFPDEQHPASPCLSKPQRALICQSPFD